MSHSKVTGSYLDSSRQPISPVKQTANSSNEKDRFSKVSNLENNPSTSFGYGHPCFQNDAPCLLHDHSSFLHGHTSFRHDQPTFQGDEPSFPNDEPTFDGDTTAMEENGDGLKAQDSDLWKVGANSNVEETIDRSADEMGIMLSEELGNFSTELRDDVMMMKPSLQQQEDQDESIVTKAQLLLRDAVEYRQKLAAIKDQYSASIKYPVLSPRILQEPKLRN